LIKVGVRHIVWPAMTSNLTPKDTVWNQLKQRLDDRTPTPSDLAELHVSFVEEWTALPWNNIIRLVRSVRRRCQAVIGANDVFLWIHKVTNTIATVFYILL
uniref:Tc1-like transposase DDE domain-containing protein n=1 Tax=Oryzias latipes TaxID=8090 RepID=A0A3P9GY33_ORYLA